VAGADDFEIEYVGEATFTLDVTQAGAFSPSAAFSQYYHGALGLIPATGDILSVGGTLSDTAHRYVIFDSSIDLSRSVGVVRPASHRPSNSDIAHGIRRMDTLRQDLTRLQREICEGEAGVRAVYRAQTPFDQAIAAAKLARSPDADKPRVIRTICDPPSALGRSSNTGGCST
jgi:hypothetical protein